MPDVRTERAWTEHLPAHSNGPVLDDELLANEQARVTPPDLPVATCHTHAVHVSPVLDEATSPRAHRRDLGVISA